MALLVAVPGASGTALTQELYSPHLDVHQRMLILETLASAARQMANPRLRLEAGGSQTAARQQGPEAISSGRSLGPGRHAKAEIISGAG